MGRGEARDYVHGYSEREARRLDDQAASIRELIHHDTTFPETARVLEVACGVGAQTETIASRNPGTRFVSFDVARDSLAQSAERVRARRLANVQLLGADLFALPFPDGAFDHLFVSYVLEHMQDPPATLLALKRALAPGGTITVVEGDHGSCYFHPRSEPALRAWNCLIDVQARMGGDSLIGRSLFPLLEQAGFVDVAVSPRMVYADRSRPTMMDLFVARTIVPMVEGVETEALEWGLISRPDWDEGLRHLRGIATRPDGAFCYTFFKGVAKKPA